MGEIREILYSSNQFFIFVGEYSILTWREKACRCWDECRLRRRSLQSPSTSNSRLAFLAAENNCLKFRVKDEKAIILKFETSDVKSFIRKDWFDVSETVEFGRKSKHQFTEKSSKKKCQWKLWSSVRNFKKLSKKTARTRQRQSVFEKIEIKIFCEFRREHHDSNSSRKFNYLQNSAYSVNRFRRNASEKFIKVTEKLENFAKKNFENERGKMEECEVEVNLTLHRFPLSPISLHSLRFLAPSRKFLTPHYFLRFSTQIPNFFSLMW